MWDWILSGRNLAFVSAGIAAVALLIYVVSTLSLKYYRKAHNIPLGRTNFKFNTRTITYIAMLTAVSTTVTVVISMVIPVTVFPPIRVAFEGIMIKITGMLFGPIIGIIVGFSTELLTMIFVPSYIQPAYFIIAVCFGFWGGLSSYTFKWKGLKQLNTLALITVFMIVSTIVMYFILSRPELAGLDGTNEFFGFAIPEGFYPSLFLIVMAITLVLIYLIFVILYFTKQTKLLSNVLPVILTCVVTELLCTILIAPWGDSQIMNSDYMSMMILRCVQTPVKIAFNTTVLTTVYTVLKPLIMKD